MVCASEPYNEESVAHAEKRKREDRTGEYPISYSHIALCLF